MGYLSALSRWGTTFFVRVEHPFLNESLQWTYPIAASVVTVRSRFAGALLLGECGQCFPFGADGGVVAVAGATHGRLRKSQQAIADGGADGRVTAVGPAGGAGPTGRDPEDTIRRVAGGRG